MKVWITGASSGIGEACAYEYARQGASLILTARSKDKLEAVADECRRRGVSDVEMISYDLEKPEGIEELTEKAWERFGGLDVVFLNAGVSQRTRVEDTSMEMARRIMETNFFAPAAIAQAVLPKMIGANGGRIAVTTSIAGRFGFPLRCAYSSSKFALYGYFESLQAENACNGIKVTMVCPGRVKTAISMNALDKGGVKHGQMDPGQAGGLDAGKAAKKIIRAVEKGKREVLVGRKELLMVYIKRFFPGLCARLSIKLKPI